MRDAARKVGDKVVNQCQFTTQGSSCCPGDHLFEIERVYRFSVSFNI